MKVARFLYSTINKVRKMGYKVSCFISRLKFSLQMWIKYSLQQELTFYYASESKSYIFIVVLSLFHFINCIIFILCTRGRTK